MLADAAASVGRPGSDSSPEACVPGLEQYRECMARAKERARAGELEAALELLREAMVLRPSARLERRLRRLQEALDAQEGEDEWAPVDGCGLRLYRPLLEQLQPYQRRGVAFLHRLYADKRGGGILADDMGLGKTVQLLAFLSGMFDADLVRCCLVLMPASLLATWSGECAKWTPGLRVKAFHGSKAERSRNLQRVQRRGGVVITTYQLVIYNLEQLSHLDGQQFTWDYLVLDEAHKIKSHLSKTTKHVNAIPAKNRVLLTGTPVQNNLEEMWTLFDFACQGALLGPLKTFKMMYENPITRAREKDATPEEKALGLCISESLVQLTQPYFLRRTKEGILKLEKPPGAEPEGRKPTEMLVLSRKNDLIVWVHLSQVQEEIYRKFVSSEQIQKLLQTKVSPLVQLNNLKKLCDHPRLLSKRMWEELGLSGGDEAVDSNDTRLVSVELLVQESGKLAFLLGLLENLREEGHRTLVFSQSRKMLDIIQRVLTARGFRLTRMDGTMPLLERHKVVESFQRHSDCSVFLLTTQVGGVGLTLTAANRVVIIDPSWNPATDAQAVDRVYRIGQTDNVVIYRLVTCGSVEEKIYRRQIFKDSLIRQTVGERKNPFRYFSRQELRELFVLEDTGQSHTQMQLQELHGSQRGTDAEFNQHVAFLHSLPVFGVTDHNLVHSRDVAPEEEGRVSDPASQQYIQHRVRLAQDLVALGSQREPGARPAPSPPAVRGRGGRKIPEPDSGEYLPPMDLPSDREMEDEVANLSYPEGSKILEPDSGKNPPLIDLTQLPSNSEAEDDVSNLSYPERSMILEPDSRENPPAVDLTQLPSDSEMEDEVSNLSCLLAQLPVCSDEHDDSLVFVPSVQSPRDAGTPMAQGGGDATRWDPDTRGESSPDPTSAFQRLAPESQGELFAAGLQSTSSRSLLQSDFRLVLEETMEEVDRSEARDSSDYWVERAGEPAGRPRTLESESPAIVSSRRRRRLRVLDSDSDSEEQTDQHPDLLLETFIVPAASTPKESNFPPLANSSFSSRRSLVKSVLDDIKDEEDSEEDLVSGSSVPVGRSLEEERGWASEGQLEGECATELAGVFGGDPGDPEARAPTTGSDEETESDTNHSELSSNEQFEPFAKAAGGLTDLNAGTAREGSGSPEPPEGEYESLDLDSVIQELTGLFDAAARDGSGSLELPLADYDSLLLQLTEPASGIPGEGIGSPEPPLEGYECLGDLESLMHELTGLSNEPAGEGTVRLQELDPGTAGEGAGFPEPPVGGGESLVKQHSKLDTPGEGTRPEPTGGEHESTVKRPTELNTGMPGEGRGPEPLVREREGTVNQPTELDTRTPREGTRPEPLLEEYESLVKRGRERLERGELKAALGCLLQALDLKSGDPEVQLTTIKLYRQLDRS